MHSLSSADSGSARAATAERTASIAAGALLMVPVLRQRSSKNWAAAAAGAALIYKGATGTWNITDSLVSNGRQAAPTRIRQSITIRKDAGQLFSMWRNPDVLTRVMQPFGEVDMLGKAHLRWKMSLAGVEIAGEAVLTEERPGELVHWRSAPVGGLAVDERMLFKMAPQGRGTEATLEYEFDFSGMPAGRPLRALTSFLQAPARTAIRKVLHNFKSLAETGEIATLERNPSARADNRKHRGDLV